MGNATQRKDPLTAFCFSLQIDDLNITAAQAFFRSVKGLKSESEVVEYKEGGCNTMGHRLIGPTKFQNLVLEQGFTGPPFTLLEWRNGFLNDETQALNRVNGKVLQYGHDMRPICAWHFLEGWCVKWEGPSFNAEKQELAIEMIEIAHHGLVFESLV